MVLQSISLRNFRSHRSLDLRFDNWGCFIHGANGSGKTNILEAIHLLAYFKSFRSATSDALISWENDSAEVFGEFTDQSGLETQLLLQIGKKKSRRS